MMQSCGTIENSDLLIFSQTRASYSLPPVRAPPSLREEYVLLIDRFSVPSLVQGFYIDTRFFVGNANPPWQTQSPFPFPFFFSLSDLSGIARLGSLPVGRRRAFGRCH